MKQIVFALMVVLGMGSPVFADQLISSYFALLSSHDHFNSRGTPLRTAEAILTQDRANFYRFKTGDYQDEGDGFFTSVQRRQMIPAMLRRGSITPNLRHYIVNNEVGVWVEIWQGANGYYLMVDMPG